jgi:PAS domain S-box-containing protein
MNILQGVLAPTGIKGVLTGVALALVVAALVGAWLYRKVRNRFQARYDTLAATNRRNFAIVEASGEGVLELDNSAHVRYANPAAAKMLGYELEELYGLEYRTLINSHEEGNTRSDPVRKVRYTTDLLRGVGALLRRKDGRYRPVEYKIVPMTEQGASLGTVLAFRDVSERERLDNLLKDMQATAQIGAWEYVIESKRLQWTDVVYAIHDLPVGHPITQDAYRKFIHPDDLPQLLAAGAEAAQSGRSADLQMRMTSAKGRHLWVRLIVKAERRNGKVVRLHGTFQDVTDRVHSEHKVRETRDFYELTLDAMPTPVMFIDAELKITYANKAVEEWVGRTRPQLLGKHVGDALPVEIATATKEHSAAALRGEALSVTQSGVRNGRARDWQNHFVPEVGPNGRVRGFFSIVYDLSELKRLEARLLQAQKMEAIGQLTGGIAHDFNNLLGIVLGNLQLLERSVAETPALARKVHTAMRAAVRGADLTRRLLALARRQIFDPTVVDLNKQLAGLGDLMQRTLGDSIDVRMVQSSNLWHTRVDAGQLENAILNLAINARDAMPQGGRLTVQTENAEVDADFSRDHPQIEPGQYVAVRVNDTGTGIEPEVLKRVFEPFFTTKESGKGSGLGLAMVHGFAEQSGGLATIESQLGRGTTVQILLPRCDEQTTQREDTIVTKVAPGGNETILVVEDDADLRDTVVMALSQLGYHALAAANAATAIRILSGPQPVDLLFTDVMMPGGTLGPALAKRARELRPDIDVLFTTGYAETSALAGHAGVGGVGTADVIHKPYRNEDLAMRIRYVLDREARVA